MQKYLGDILLEKGYLSREQLDRALSFQMRRSIGREPPQDGITSFILEVARTRYNRRGEHCLGKILAELELLPEDKLQEALEIQRRNPVERPRGRLATLHLVLTRINSSFNLIDLLNQILVLAAELVEAECASLIIHDMSRDALVILMPTGPKAEEVRDLVVPVDKGIVGWVYQNGRSVISNDAAHDRRFYPEIDTASGFESRQLLCVPLTVKGRRLGAIEVINKAGRRATRGRRARPSGFSRQDRFLLEMFSAQAAVAIENTRLADAYWRLESDCRAQKESIASSERRRAAAVIADAALYDMKRTLVPLSGYAARIHEGPAESRAEKYSGYIEDAMGTLISRAEDVVRYFKGDYPLKRETQDLGGLLRELETRTWVDCRISGIAFVLSVSEGIQIHADRELFLRCLDGLFRNSREAMPDGGTFTISAMKTETWVSIRVSDTGPGLACVDSEKIFEPFYSCGKRHGAGLGLPIARGIIEAHGGSIRADDASGGATFVITLPLFVDPQPS